MRCWAIGLSSLLALLIQCSSSATLAPTHGVSPQDISLYSVKGDFKCKDGSQSIPAALINDDYCDCPDGSDEPGTSACHNSLFFCPNKGHKSIQIFSSRINDGVCDCCDGSDEYDGIIKCGNTCLEMGASIRKELIRKIEMHEQGLLKRPEYLQKATSYKEGITKRKDELEALIADAAKQVEEKNVLKEELQQKVDAEEDARREEEEKKRLEEEAKLAAEEKAAADAAPENVKPADDDIGAAEAEQAAPVQQEEDLPPLPDSPHDEIRQPSEDDLPYVDDEGYAYEEGAAQEPEPESEASKSLRAIQDEIRPIEDEKRKHENELKLAKEVLEYDFGPDQAYMGLYDKCFTQNVQQYTYEICLFRKSTQKDGGSSQNLGGWGHWNTEGRPYSVMHYTNGGGCWNGPSRSTKVTLICGEDEFVVGVQEPSRCVYEMEFMTPLACSQEEADALRQELQAMGI